MDGCMSEDSYTNIELESPSAADCLGIINDSVGSFYGISKKRVICTSGDIDNVFNCVSRMCLLGGSDTPLKSNPMYRGALPLVKIVKRQTDRSWHSKSKFSFHLPPDYRFLYPAAPLAYYLGASVEVDDEPFIAFRSAEPMPLPCLDGLEQWMGEKLSRVFYLDCAVRYAWASGGTLNGMDVQALVGRCAGEVFNMGAEERFLLYTGLNFDMREIPEWHMASYLDPVAESVEALPFLLRSLSAIYMPRSVPVTERALVSRAVRDFLGRQNESPDMCDNATGSVVLPALRKAGSQLWFSDGFPVDAAKSSVRAFLNRQKYGAGKRQARVGVICNDPAMEREVDIIIEALSNSPVSMQVYWNTGASDFSEIFARGFDIVQLIGHCDAQGFRCSDRPARIEDVTENNTPMFFFNSCSSHREAARLIEKGSVCGVATFFRVLEEAAVDVCRNFYLLLGEGYPASVSIGAAMECSVLGKEYLLLGDGSYACFGRGEIKRFYRLTRQNGAYKLGCTMSNDEKGFVVCSWFVDGERAVSDLGFETGCMTGEQLSAIAGKFKGCCMYDRSIYMSVEDAVLKALEDDLEGQKATRRCRKGKRPRCYD